MLIINKYKKKILNLYLKLFSYYSYKNNIFISKKSVIATYTTIDYGTRVNGKIIIKGNSNVHIGKYCAIGSDVKIITSNHDYSYMNLQLTLQRKIGVPVAHVNPKCINIGHNVWIGDSVIILSGVQIGNGAVIGAGSIVTKDIPAYAIAVGSPAKIKKYRFSKSYQDEFENLKWWDLSLDQMKEKKDYFNKKYGE